MKKGKIAMLILTLFCVLMAAFFVGCSEENQETPNDTRQYIYERNKDKYTDEYLQLCQTFAEYAGVDIWDVEFSSQPVISVSNVIDDIAYCNGTTKLYTFSAGKHSGTYFCDSDFIYNSLDGTYYLDPYGEYNISKEYLDSNPYALPRKVHSSVSFSKETEAKLNYTSEEIVEIYNNRFKTEETDPLFEYIEE